MSELTKTKAKSKVDFNELKKLMEMMKANGVNNLKVDGYEINMPLEVTHQPLQVEDSTGVPPMSDEDILFYSADGGIDLTGGMNG